VGINGIKYFTKRNIRIIKLLILPVIFVILILTLSIDTRAYTADSVSVSYLLKNVHAMNGKEIYLRGEAIGQIIGKGEYKWVNVLDVEGNAIGIWSSENEIRKIKYLGKHSIKGDTVLIRGTFNKSCIQHDGEVDIHADKIEIEKLGFIEKERTIPLYKIFILLILLIISIITIAIKKIFRNKHNNDY